MQKFTHMYYFGCMTAPTTSAASQRSTFRLTRYLAEISDALYIRRCMALMAVRLSAVLRTSILRKMSARSLSGGKLDDGVGKADGAGGAVGEAGGSFGKMEAGMEEQYFRELQKEQFEKKMKELKFSTMNTK